MTLEKTKAAERDLEHIQVLEDRLPILLDLAYKYIGIHEAKATAYANEARTIAQALNNLPGIAESLRIDALLQFYDNDLSKAIETLEAAEAVYQKLPKHLGYTKVLNNFGLVYYKMVELDKSLEYYNKAIEHCISIQGPNDELAKCYNNIGILYERKGDLEKSIYYLDLTLEYYGNNKPPEEIVNTKANLAMVYNKMARNDEAIEIFKECLDIYQAMNDKVSYANTLMNIGFTYYYKKDYPTALKYLQQSLKAFKSTTWKRGIAASYSGIGNVFSMMRGFDEARTYFYKSIELYKECGEVDGESMAYLSLGDIAMMEKMYQTADNYLQKALAIAEEKGIGFVYYKTLLQLINLNKEIGETEIAAEYQRRLDLIKDQYKDYKEE